MERTFRKSQNNIGRKMRILIMGLPGSGKTSLAEELVTQLEQIGKSVLWLNADHIRRLYNDWDFSHGGRLRQAERMKKLSDVSEDNIVIADFVAPLPEMRDIYGADIIIWVDTITKGLFEDTNKLFVPPEKYDFRVTEQDVKRWVDIIIHSINIPS